MATDKKYELVGSPDNNGLRRIRALRTFDSYLDDWEQVTVRKGDLGGKISSEKNLSHEGMSWVGRGATVTGGAEVMDDAVVIENAVVTGCAKIMRNAIISGNASVANIAVVTGGAKVMDNARVGGAASLGDETIIGGNAEVSTDGDFAYVSCWWSDHRESMTWTRTDRKWHHRVLGSGTAEELINKTRDDGYLGLDSPEFRRLDEMLSEPKALERRLDRWFLGGFLAGTANFALWMWIWGTAV